MEGNMPASNHIHINLAKNLESSHFLYLLIPCQWVHIYIYICIIISICIYYTHISHLGYIFFWNINHILSTSTCLLYQITHLEAPAKSSGLFLTRIISKESMPSWKKPCCIWSCNVSLMKNFFGGENFSAKRLSIRSKNALPQAQSNSNSLDF